MESAAVVKMPVDPPKIKHKRIPKSSCSPPVPVMHSPPRDQQDWNIPPCIYSWKNTKDYTIPLDRRLAADGRGLEDAQISDDFAKLSMSEALYLAEQKAREAVSVGKRERPLVFDKEAEMDLDPLGLDGWVHNLKKDKKLFGSVGTMRASGIEPGGDYDDDLERERELRDKIREERERERRLEAAGKEIKITRDRDHDDISEKFALGMASVGCRGGEVMYDQRLFNQEKGMDSGFATNDQYIVYDKGLFTVQPIPSTLYKPMKDMEDEMYYEQLHKPKNTERSKPDKAFTGAGKRERPLVFDEEAEIDLDPLGLDGWVHNLKKDKKLFGSVGTMRAS